MSEHPIGNVLRNVLHCYIYLFFPTGYFPCISCLSLQTSSPNEAECKYCKRCDSEHNRLNGYSEYLEDFRAWFTPKLKGKRPLLHICYLWHHRNPGSVPFTNIVPITLLGLFRVGNLFYPKAYILQFGQHNQETCKEGRDMPLSSTRAQVGVGNLVWLSLF